MNKNVVIELGLNLDITWLKGIEKIMKVVKMRFIIWKKKKFHHWRKPRPR